MKPGCGPVFQFRAAFSFGRPVDVLWTVLNIVAGFLPGLGSQQKDRVSQAASPLVHNGFGP